MIILVITFVIIIGSFSLRDLLINSNKKNGKYSINNFLGDLLPLFIISIWLVIFPYIIPLSTCIDKCSSQSKQNKLSMLKMFLEFAVIILSIIYIQSAFTIKGKTSIMNIKLKSISSFGCPGNYTISSLTNDIINMTLVDPSSYSSFRENEVGIIYIILAFMYIILSYVKGGLILLFKYMCKKKDTLPQYVFDPLTVLFDVYSKIILLLLVVAFLPMGIVLIPIVIIIEYKYHFYRIKNKSNIIFDRTSITHMNNKNTLILEFLLLSLFSIFIL